MLLIYIYIYVYTYIIYIYVYIYIYIYQGDAMISLGITWVCINLTIKHGNLSIHKNMAIMGIEWDRNNTLIFGCLILGYTRPIL